MTQRDGNGWKLHALAWLVVLAAITAYAAATRSWFLTAAPVGFLFGFFLQKGDLCGSSAMSEVLVFRDARKLAGVWVAIAVSMVGFAVIAELGWVALMPKPLIWASALVGGAIFGAGTVLAGGCISGCLYKAGAGNLNSMAALIGMPLGIAIVEHGPLNRMHLSLKGQVIPAADGGPVTLSSLTGIPYWLLALLIAGATLAVAWRLRRPRTPGSGHGASDERPFLARPWRPWQAGIAIGLLAVPGFLSAVASGRSYPLGVTHGVLQAYELVTDDVKVVTGRPAPATQEAAPTPAPRRKVSGWLMLLVVAMIPGAWAAARMSGQARLLPKPPDEIVIAFLGGILVGVGAAFATGCVVGNILSGWALMSVGMFLFGVVTLLANWATAAVYLIGGPAVAARRNHIG
ncbi:MAG: YeeE/YedE family protein [Thermoanaerobaculales bacterium]|jgi:hypothetical protein|nr:YeeE/YedE family protein [Thermoanaerobaculales bacterium]